MRSKAQSISSRCDDQRRRDANDSIVGFLAQNSFFLERLAVGPGRTVQLDSDPQPLAAHLLQIGAAESLQPLQEIDAQLGGTFSIIFSSTSTRSAARATAQPSGLPPNVLPWSPGWKTPQNFA